MYYRYNYQPVVVHRYCRIKFAIDNKNTPIVRNFRYVQIKTNIGTITVEDLHAF